MYFLFFCYTLNNIKKIKDIYGMDERYVCFPRYFNEKNITIEKILKINEIKKKYKFT